MNDKIPAVIPAAGVSKTGYRRNPEKKIQKYRTLIQSLFALLCVWIGVEFYLFVEYLETDTLAGHAYRPPGVEGFLPISSLMSLYHFFISGEIHPAHPAGMFILAAIVVMSLVFGKSFCSWLCPAGFLSEMLGDIGDKLFGRRFKLPRRLDYSLRSLKYLLLGFFVYSIFFLMTASSLRAFLGSPYNIVADIKMYYFFAEISRTALVVIAVLMLLSVAVRNFWCRYLCPYGALLGLLSLLSPHKIKRRPVSCIDCGKCARVCPSFIKVDRVETVVSDECTACLNCVDACPVADTLTYRSLITKRKLSPKTAAVGVAAIFVVITGLGMLTGHWQNNVTVEEYRHHQQYLKSYGHPTGSRDIEEYNRRTDDENREP